MKPLNIDALVEILAGCLYKRVPHILKEPDELLMKYFYLLGPHQATLSDTQSIICSLNQEHSGIINNDELVSLLIDYLRLKGIDAQSDGIGIGLDYFLITASISWHSDMLIITASKHPYPLRARDKSRQLLLFQD